MDADLLDRLMPLVLVFFFSVPFPFLTLVVIFHTFLCNAIYIYIYRFGSVPEGYHLVIIELGALSGTYLHRLLMDARFDDF